MNHSQTVAAALILGFFVFVTVRGELPAYMRVVGLAL